MEYERIRWIHDNPNEPILIMGELDDARMELRKIEIFPNGSIGYAMADREFGGTMMGDEAWPPLLEITQDPQFVSEPITAEEFEQLWKTATAQARSDLQ